MDVSDYRILQVIYLTLENTILERQQMSPFQFRRLIMETLQSRRYSVYVLPDYQRTFVVNGLIILYFPLEIEYDEIVCSYLMELLQSDRIGEKIRIAYSVRNSTGACLTRIELPEN